MTKTNGIPDDYTGITEMRMTVTTFSTGEELVIDYKTWYVNGKIHREDGPAIEYANGEKFWYLNDTKYSEEEFNQWRIKKLLNDKLQQLPHKNKVKRGKI